MMSQSLATYPLVQCVVSAAQFASGEVSFYDTYAELMAADAEGSCTAPLRIDYDVLEHFRIVRAQRVMRLTMPRVEVRRWAKENGFASQLDAFEDVQEAKRDTKTAATSQTTSAVLLLQLRSEDLSRFLQTIAPLVSASRRARSVSRISVTEPLPLYATLIDPAPDVESETRASSSLGRSSHSGTATPEAPSQKSNAEVMPSEHQRDEQHDDKLTLSQPLPVPPSGVKRCSAERLSTKMLTARLGESPVLLGDEHHRDESRKELPVRGAAEELQQVETLPPSPPPSAQQHAMPDTLASVEEELAGLAEDAEYPPMYSTMEGRRGHHVGQPLKRPGPVLPAALLGGESRQSNYPARGGGGSHSRSGRMATNKGKERSSTKVATAPSLCPSLTSCVADGHAERRPMVREGNPVDPLSPALQAIEAKRKERPHRLVITHLCASDNGSSTPAKAPAAAMAPNDRTSVEEDNFVETVATVTLQSDKIQKGRRESRIRSPFQVESERQDSRHRHATSDNEAAAAKEVTRSADDASTNGSRLHNWPNPSRTSPRKSVHPQHKPPQPKSNKIHSPASSSVLVGDFFSHDDALRKTRELNGAVAELTAVLPSAHAPVLASNDATAHKDVAASAEPRRSVKFPHNVSDACSLKPPQVRLLNAEVRRDVRSYLLDLFPKTSAPTRQLNKSTAKVSAVAATAAAAPSIPRRRGRPPKVKAADTAPQRPPTQRKQTDAAPAMKEDACRVQNSGAAFTYEQRAMLRFKTSPTSLPMPPRKRSRSETPGAAVSAMKHRPTCRGDSATAFLSNQAKQKKRQTTSCRVPDNGATSCTGIDGLSAARDSGMLGPAHGASPFAKDASFLLRRNNEPPQAFKKTEKTNDWAAAACRCSREKGLQTNLNCSGEEREAAAPCSDEGEDTAAAAGRIPLTSLHEALDPQHASLRGGSILHDAVMVEQQHSHPKSNGSSGAERRRDAALADAPPDPTAAASYDVESSSSKATCPLFYRCDSRKERARRLLRYMNLVSQHLAMMHESHDELRGLLLTMLNDSQL
ncbi:hypothetical protein ABB37_00126 [Leptomonas pyrrhocoris]|uniref:Uncharacterized protein n=1 Tax=Leptomonas pyrrhocoris TaxID=157538 RepID=A0A0N0DZW8_LEPPY|nr:hypothetical protein ABB37_00126 [Leptomonas pyrrhocoris]KPA85772.1 hypothetical protein ABB37_00126 [Leptomonas pyrrhocoris]|eukprot:XP_015664211.1 hypothetical protein ABB37_00126 [Leptomonas pyrrhocoris]